MTVTIVMHGTLRRFLPDGAARATLDLRAGATIEEVLVGLGAEKDTWVVARNQAVAERDAVLAPGDVLDCFEPVSGGCRSLNKRAACCGGRRSRWPHASERDTRSSGGHRAPRTKSDRGRGIPRPSQATRRRGRPTCPFAT